MYVPETDRFSPLHRTFGAASTGLHQDLLKIMVEDIAKGMHTPRMFNVQQSVSPVFCPVKRITLPLREGVYDPHPHVSQWISMAWWTKPTPESFGYIDDFLHRLPIVRPDDSLYLKSDECLMGMNLSTHSVRTCSHLRLTNTLMWNIPYRCHVSVEYPVPQFACSGDDANCCNAFTQFVCVSEQLGDCPVEQAVVYSTLPQEYSTLTFRGEVVAGGGGVEERSHVLA